MWVRAHTIKPPRRHIEKVKETAKNVRAENSLNGFLDVYTRL